MLQSYPQPQSEKVHSIWQQNSWRSWQKILFRFGFIYLLIYILPNFLNLIGGIFVSTEVNILKPLVKWVGSSFLSTGNINVMPNGSGDTTYNYVEVFTIFILAIIGSIIWTLLDFKRKKYTDLLYWLVVVIRYMLGITMLMYGLAKVFKTQFPEPSLLSMLKPFGESSPMGLLWKFMGYSLAYNIFTGLGETIGGLLLFFRKTSTLGALILVAVLSNVVILNFSYDVPVKLFSSHLLLMSLIIIVLDGKRLLNLLVLNKPAMPAKDWQALSKRFVLPARILKGIIVIGSIVLISYQFYQMFHEYGGSNEPPLFGVYEVQQLIRNQDTISAHTQYASRWQRMIVDKYDRFHIQDMRNNFNYYQLETDTSEQTLKIFTPGDNKNPLYEFNYALDANQHMNLTGVSLSDSIFVVLEKKNDDYFQLSSRGFHWVNEYPFNR